MPARTQPRLYTDLAPWFHRLTHPDDYRREARMIRKLLALPRTRSRPQVLELGSGGGNNAFHLKRHFDLTLTDLSPAMLKISRAINPECAHETGDMRRLRLKRLFDAAYVQDAVMYLKSERDVAAMTKSLARHVRPGAPVLILPDFTTECFNPRQTTGGRRIGKRELSYLEVTRPHPSRPDRVIVDMTLHLREEGRSDRIEVERHEFGLFPRRTWLKHLRAAGFRARRIVDPWGRDVFRGTRA